MLEKSLKIFWFSFPAMFVKTYEITIENICSIYTWADSCFSTCSMRISNSMNQMLNTGTGGKTDSESLMPYSLWAIAVNHSERAVALHILQAPSLVLLFLYLSIWKFLYSNSVSISKTDKIVHYLSVLWFQPSPNPPSRRDPPKKIYVTSTPEYLVQIWGLSFPPHMKCHELVPRLDLTIATP